jgi:uncharacterized membrane protein
MGRRFLLFSLVLWAGAAAHAATAPSPLVGLYLTTPYPALTVRAGEPAVIDLTLRNFNRPPQQVTLAVPEISKGWKATFLGGGQPVEAAIVPPNETRSLQLRLEPPKDAGPEAYRFVIQAKGAEADLKLPLTLTIRKGLPAKLKLTTDLPALRGAASASYQFKVAVANDSGRDATIDFSADAPPGFTVSYTQAFGSQQITSIPIQAGQSKDIEATVALPPKTRAGLYKIVFHAKSEAASASLPLTVTIVGQPRLTLTGVGERLSGEAYAGTSTPLTLVVRNTGSAAARDIGFDASAPEGWKTSFDPKNLPVLAPGKVQQVKLLLTPSGRAISGDYQMTVSANAADALSDSQNFRITVLTSTLWGAVGIGIIAAALLVVVFAVARFGRR